MQGTIQLLNDLLRAFLQYTVEPRYNKGLRDWENMFVITRFRYIEVLFHIFYCHWLGLKKKQFVMSRTSLYRGSLNRGSTVVCVITTKKYLLTLLSIVVVY